MSGPRRAGFGLGLVALAAGAALVVLWLADAPAPSPVPEAAWSELELPDMTPVATLGATQVGPAGVACTARFTLTSLGKTSASKLAKGIATEARRDIR